jgi:uncharacterized protein
MRPIVRIALVLAGIVLSAFLLWTNRLGRNGQPDLGNALIEASAKGDVHEVELLLSRGAPVNAQNQDGGSPLIKAAFAGHQAVTELLLAKGASPNVAARTTYYHDEGHCVYTETALMDAAMMGHREIVRSLLDNGADVNARDTCYGDTALILATIMGNQEIVELLLERGAVKNVRDSGGFTAQDWAAKKRFDSVLHVMMTHGSDRR